MQTFLPYPDYQHSAEVLKPQHLGWQRLEVVWILDVLHELRDKDRNHPVMKMWRGYEPQLCEYGITICEEWKKRGYQDTILPKIEQHLDWATSGQYTLLKPPWFGDTEFHLAHQSNLVRKDRRWYRKFFPDVPDDLPYIWPEV